MRGVDKDEIILSILKEGAKTPVELRDEAIKRGVSRSRFYEHINKLVEKGEVKEAKYELIARIKEANRQDVDSSLKILIEDDNNHVIFSRLEQLTKLSWDWRLLHFPNVIQNIGCLLDRKEIIGDERNLNQFFECLNAMLFFEQDRQGVDWEKLTESLLNNTVEKASKLLLKSPNSRIIEYLGRTNRENAVKVLFQMMKQHQIKEGQNEYCTVAMALGKDRLYKDHSMLINLNLDDFLRSGDERLIKLATKLRERIV